jgi:hypothetical protein
MQNEYSLLNDPIFYIMLAFFALLTTALPAALGQPRFLPLAQTVALFVFLSIALRRGAVRQAIRILVIWLVLQLGSFIVITRLAPAQVEHAISDGFPYRQAFIGWFYGAEALPASLWTQPISRLIELLGVLVGSLVTGGLLGVWFLVRATNLAAYGAGALWQSSGVAINVLGGLPVWTLLRLAGYAGAIVLLAEPLLTGNWALSYYITKRRRLLLVSASLLLSGLLLELILPTAWRSLFM